LLEVAFMFSSISGKTNRVGLFFLAAALIFVGTGCVQTRYAQEVNLGAKAFKAGNYEAAHRHALAAYQEAPDKTSVKGLLGWTYLKRGRLSEAEKLFAEIHRQDSKSPAGLQGLAWVEYSKGRLTEAEAWFKKEMDWAQGHLNNPNWERYGQEDKQYIFSIVSDANYGLGLTAAAKGDLESAAQYLTQALKTPNDFSGHRPIRTALGDLYYNHGKYLEAAEHYRGVLAETPDTDVLIKLALSLQYAGQTGEAEKVLGQALDKAADKRPLLYALVFNTYNQNRTAEAQVYLKELIALDPYYADTNDIFNLIDKTSGWKNLWKDFAAAYYNLGDYGRTLYKLAGYLPLAPNDCEALLMEAWSQLYQGALDAAVQRFETLAGKGRCPKDQVLTGRGVALFYQDRLDEAQKAFLEAQRLNPDNIRAKAALGAVAYRRGNYEEAVKYYSSSLHLLPKTDKFFSWPSHALNNLGWSCIYTGRYKEALDAFLRLSTLHPQPVYPAVYNGLGWAYLFNGRADEARKAFWQALGLAPADPLALAGLESAVFFTAGKY